MKLDHIWRIRKIRFIQEQILMQDFNPLILTDLNALTRVHRNEPGAIMGASRIFSCYQQNALSPSNQTLRKGNIDLPPIIPCVPIVLQEIFIHIVSNPKTERLLRPKRLIDTFKQTTSESTQNVQMRQVVQVFFAFNHSRH